MFWKDGLIKKNRAYLLLTMIGMMFIMMTGCGDKLPEISDIKIERTSSEMQTYSSNEKEYADAEIIAEIYQDIYDNTIETDILGSLEIKRRIITRLGEKGYVAVDSDNQIDMAGAEQALAFCKTVEKEENDKLTIIVITDLGFRKFDMETKDGNVNIVREYYQYDQNGHIQNKSTVSYPADIWQYTEEGYLFFEGSYFSDENFVLTLSDVPEYTALRILPLDETCRELNRKYILPVGYARNNMFLTDWSEEDFGDLDFYDIFDIFYPSLYKTPFPYVPDENLGVEAVYQIPEEIFEKVIMAYFDMDKEILRRKTIYFQENAAYEYRPRGFYEAEYPDIPYPEVVSYTENEDGTITLFINAVYPNESTSKSFSHRTIIRPSSGNCFQYVSNQTISIEDENDIWWHSERLSKKYMENCLISEAEKNELRDNALTAAEQVKEIYKSKEFTKEQCKEVVTLLGKSGLVSVAENTNMENYEDIEAFYAAYMEKQDAMVTIYDVNRDGLIGAVTFIYRDDRLQTYYVGIGWKEGGIPEIRSTLVSDIAEIKLTEKGYFIYTFEKVIAHSGLRQYWRIKPLSDKCRELTSKYIDGLSYVNYNVLVTNWDSSNVEDILMPCMFEDIYRIYTGENLKVENWRIPADIYEKIMTTYFPVSVEQVRKKCGYDENSDSYEYEMISASPYPPFGEVVDYIINDVDDENSDGIITLIVDGVWAEYNSDIAFTNIIQVQPFDDGTFRYLSNSIEQKELELPEVARDNDKY